MKRIYVINERSNAAIYGIGTFLREYIECLKEMDFKIYIIELNYSQKEFQIKEEKELTTYLIPYSVSLPRDKYFGSLIHVFRLYIRDLNNMIFHLNYSGSESLVKLLREYYPLSKILYTIHYQNWTWELNGNIKLYSEIVQKMNIKAIQSKYAAIVEDYKKEKLLYDQVDKLICLSKDAFYIVKNIYQQDGSKISLIPNGLRDERKKRQKRSLSVIKANHFIGEDTKLLLYVGRLDKLKGIECLILSFSSIVTLYSNCRLVIVGGGGDFSRLLKLAKNVASKITFTGALSQKELKQWYQIADIGIIPSYAEQFGYVGVEMMMHNLPIIASDGFGVHDMFTDGINGKVFSIGNRKNIKEFQTNLCKAIIELLTSSELCEKLSYGARKVYGNNYRLEDMRIGYKGVFDSMNICE